VKGKGRGRTTLEGSVEDDAQKLKMEQAAVGWVVNGESVHKIKGNLDHYLGENRRFK